MYGSITKDMIPTLPTQKVNNHKNARNMNLVRALQKASSLFSVRLGTCSIMTLHLWSFQSCNMSYATIRQFNNLLHVTIMSYEWKINYRLSATLYLYYFFSRADHLQMIFIYQQNSIIVLVALIVISFIKFSPFEACSLPWISPNTIPSYLGKCSGGICDTIVGSLWLWQLLEFGMALSIRTSSGEIASNSEVSTSPAWSNSRLNSFASSGSCKCLQTPCILLSSSWGNVLQRARIAMMAIQNNYLLYLNFCKWQACVTYHLSQCRVAKRNIEHRFMLECNTIDRRKDESTNLFCDHPGNVFCYDRIRW